MTSWMDWNGIMLSEIIQTKKYCMVSHVESQKKKRKRKKQIANRLVAAGDSGGEAGKMAKGVKGMRFQLWSKQVLGM